jgi:hypothetical protein
MTYTNLISLNDALYFGLFDEIPFRQVKRFFDEGVNRDECDFEVYIENLPCDIPAWGKVLFEFSLMVLDINENGMLTIMTNKRFTKEFGYNTSSCYALLLSSLQIDEDEEEKEDEDEEDEDEDEEEKEEEKEEERRDGIEEQQEKTEAVRVKRFDFEYKRYFKGVTNNKIYDTITHEELGYWNENENRIVFE